MFGGDNRQLGYSPAFLTFVTAPTTDLNMILKVKLHDYVGTNYPTKTINFVVPAGSLSFNISDNLAIDGFYYNAGFQNIYQTTGYYTIEVISSNSSFVSILPFYHWGQSN